jgi:hypothetical protein
VIEDMELINDGEFSPAQVALNTYSWTKVNANTQFIPYGIE